MKLSSILDSFSLELSHQSQSGEVYTGVANDSTGQRVYGGQVMAQALSAAQQSVDSAYRVHSMQCNFFRPGSSQTPLRYEVALLRTG